MLQGLEIVEVVIGLMLVFLVLSIAVTAINEWIAHVWSLRANNLYEGIENLIGRRLTEQLYLHSSIAGTTSDPAIASRLRGQTTRPSYIEGPLFVQTLLDLLVPSSFVDGKVDLKKLHDALSSPTDADGFARIAERLEKDGDCDAECKKYKVELEMEIKRLKIALDPILASAKGFNEVNNARAAIERWFFRRWIAIQVNTSDEFSSSQSEWQQCWSFS